MKVSSVAGHRVLWLQHEAGQHYFTWETTDRWRFVYNYMLYGMSAMFKVRLDTHRSPKGHTLVTV